MGCRILFCLHGQIYTYSFKGLFCNICCLLLKPEAYVDSGTLDSGNIVTVCVDIRDLNLIKRVTGWLPSGSGHMPFSLHSIYFTHKQGGHKLIK